MKTEMIIETIKTIIAGRSYGRVTVERNEGAFDVRAFVLNADGIGRRDTLLASLATQQDAITVQRTLNFANGRY